MNWHRKLLGVLAVLVLVLTALPSAVAQNAQQTDNIDPELLRELAAEGSADFFITFWETADLTPAYAMDWHDRGYFVVETLQAVADTSQANVRAWLEEHRIAYTIFWINNSLFVHADEATLNALAAFPEVSGFRANHVAQIFPEKPAVELAANQPEAPAYPWNITFPMADQVHALLGIKGQGVVVGGMDTGVEYNHQGLVKNYRGCLNPPACTVFDHTYSWNDPSNSCGGTPCDTDGHGTATMGIMAGDDDPALPAGAWIGMAPDAQWIHCIGCPYGSCPDFDTNACAQWFLAPGGDTDLRPRVVNHSWGLWSPNDCDGNSFQAQLMAYRAADIVPAFAAGNVGDACNTSTSPANNTDPDGNPIAFASGAHGIDGSLDYYSSCGWNACNPTKLFPDVASPGLGSCTTGLGNTYNCDFGGTSSASPHTAGCVGLVRSANPFLTVAEVEQVIRDAANDVDDTSCGGTVDWNNRYGEGHLDCYEAVEIALSLMGDTTLQGQVTEAMVVAAPGDPLPGVLVQAQGVTITHSAVTNDQGYYSMLVYSGTYTVRAEKYGYLPTVIPGVVVETGVTKTLDITMTPAPAYVVDGYVTDATTGWPLYARIDIDGHPYSPVWTNPETGYYSVTLAGGMVYTFHVDAWSGGYVPEDRDVGPLTGPQTEDFQLLVDAGACTAPGYSFGAPSYFFFDDFEGGYANWTMTGLWNPESEADTCGAAVAPFPSSSNDAYYGIDGQCTYNNGSNNSGELTMAAPVPLPAAGGAVLSFWSYEQTECGGDCGYDNRYVEISTDGGGSWALLGEGYSEGAWYPLSYDLASYVGQNVWIRFRFDTIDSVGNDYFGWMVDDVAIATSVCEPLAGGLVVGNVYDDNTGLPLNGATVTADTGADVTTVATPEDPNVDDGFYLIFVEQAKAAGLQISRPAAAGGPTQNPGITVAGPAGPIVAPEAPAHPEDVLWDQPLSVVNQAAYVDQDFPDFSAYSAFLADDFINADPWEIDLIFVPGDLWSGATTLFNATALTWQIYADNAGIPAGDPVSGGALWSLSLAPTDPQVVISTGTPGGYPSNTTLNLATPLVLPPGHYWLVFYPTMLFVPSGQYGRQPADTTNGYFGQFINPGGGFGYGTAWQSWTVLGVAQHDIAFRLEGEIAEADHLLVATMEGYAPDAETVTVPPWGAVAQDFDLLAGWLVFTPTSIHVTLDMGDNTTEPGTLSNDGGVDAFFEMMEQDRGWTPLLLAVSPVPAALPPVAELGTSNVAGRTTSPGGTEVLDGGIPDAWVAAAPLPVGNVRYAKAQCPEEPNVTYVIGGVSNGSIINNLYRYDAATDSWSELAPMPSYDEGPAATCYDGKIYVAGGGYSYPAFFHIYDIATDSWTSGALYPRTGVETPAMGAWDGKVFLVGGDDDFYPGSGVSDQVNIYDIASDTWIGTGTAMPHGRSNVGYFQTGNLLYVVGGWDIGMPTNAAYTERYDMEADTWEEGPAFTPARADFPIAVTSQYIYAIAGDSDGGGYWDSTDSVWRYDWTQWPGGAWEDVGDPIPVALQAHFAGFATDAVAGGEVWSVGGLNGPTFVWYDTNQYLEAEPLWGGGDVPWLSESPVSGTVPANTDLPVGITFDAGVPEVTQPGDYFATIHIMNDTPYGKLEVPVTMTVIPPATYGKLEGTVTGLGYCDQDPVPLEEAEVVVHGSTGMSWTLLTDDAGYYQLWLDQANSPLTITATYPEYLPGQATGVVIVGQQTTTVDFYLRYDYPCVHVDPVTMSATVDWGDNATQTLTIGNSGAADLDYEATETDRGFEPLAALGWVEYLPVPEQQGAEGAVHNGPLEATVSRAPYIYHGWAPQAASIIVYCDDDQRSPTYVEQALQELGLTYTFYGDPNDPNPLDLFTNDVNGGGWDLVILAQDGWIYIDAREYTAVQNHILNGGQAIVYSWGIGYDGTHSGHGLWTAMGAQYSAWLTSPAPLYWWDDSHPLFNSPESVPEFTDLDNLGYLAYGASMTLLGEPSTGLGGFTTDPADGQAGVILREDSKTLYRGLTDNLNSADQDTDGMGDPMEWWVNALSGMLYGFSADVPWLFEDPISGTVPADGGQGIVDVTMDSLYVYQPGDYFATLNVKSNDPVVSSFPVYVTMTVLPAGDMGKVDGTVTDNCTGDPVEALVTFAGGVPVTQTQADENGYYAAWLVAGTYPVTFTAGGYLDYAATVTVTAGMTTTMDVILIPDRPCIAIDPDLFEVWLVTGTAVYTHSTGMDITNNGAQDLTFEFRERDLGYMPLLKVSIPPSDGNFPRGEGAPSIGRAPIAAAPDGVPLTSLSQILGSLAYATEAAYGFHTQFDLDVPEVLPNLGPFVPAGFPGAGEYVDDYVYVADTTNVLYQLDPATGAVLDSYPITAPPNGETYVGFAVDPTSGMLYASSTNVGTSSFFSVDVGTGVATLIGPISGSGCNIALAIDGSGQAYGYDICTDDFWAIDKNTGAGTWIGSIGFDANYGQGMGWDPASGQMYMAAFNNGTFQPELRIVDLSTGNTVMVGGPLGSTTPGGLCQLPWLAVPIAGGADVPWVWEAPISGTVPALDMANIDIAFTALYTDATPMPLGLYSATLTVANNDPVAGSQEALALMHIVEQFIPPTASFTATTPLCLGEAMAFFDASEAGVPPIIEEYLWDFGDGVGTSTEQNPTYTYGAAGLYTVTLTVTQYQTGWTDTYELGVEVLALPAAGFEYSMPACVGIDVNFTNTTTGAGPFTYLWAFGDGVTSTLENPAHAYGAAGPYTVTLGATGACGYDDFSAAIDVLPLPTAAFTYVAAGLTVTFTNSSLDADTYLWEFGDATTSTATNPVHTYEAAGTYTVTLTASGVCGEDEVSMVLEVAPVRFHVYLPLVYKAAP